MTAVPLAMRGPSLVCSVGLSAAAACAAIRAKLADPQPSGFTLANGTPVLAHRVSLEQPLRGVARLAAMAALAIDETLGACGLQPPAISGMPLLLCTSEMARPGRPAELDAGLLSAVQDVLGVRFSPGSGIVPHGRVAGLLALASARAMIAAGECDAVLVAGTDSLVTWPAIRALIDDDRLLLPDNSNGLMVGEGAGAVLVTRDTGAGSLWLRGAATATEAATVLSEAPLRAEGLSAAIAAATADAGISAHEVELRIADVSGEQYFFKEASLAMSRLMRRKRPDTDLWHPAESIGDCGAAAAFAGIAVAHDSSLHGYRPAGPVLIHGSADGPRRAAVVVTAE